MDESEERSTRLWTGSCTIALDENNFYRRYHGGITRSTDGGLTWHPFMTGIPNSDIRDIKTVKNVLYAATGNKIAKSKNGGKSWETVNVTDGYKLVVPKIEATDTTLYVSTSNDRQTQLFHLLVGDDTLRHVQDMPDFEEDDLYTEWRKRLQSAREINVKFHETVQLFRKNLSLVIQEDAANGGFTLAGETVFMEHRRKLFRWRPGETEWYYTGLEDQGEPLPMYGKGFTLGVSRNVVYAGKRDGHLFQSLDNGNTWSDITENLAFPFTYFKEIIVVGSTVYISTDAGVMNSYDDAIWSAVSDIDGHILAMNRIATDGSRLYGVCDTGVYQVNNHTNTWRQMTSEVPSTTVTSLAATGGTLYIGTEDNGVFRLQHINPEFRVSNLP